MRISKNQTLPIQSWCIDNSKTIGKSLPVNHFLREYGQHKRKNSKEGRQNGSHREGSEARAVSAADSEPAPSKTGLEGRFYRGGVDASSSGKQRFNPS